MEEDLVNRTAGGQVFVSNAVEAEEHLKEKKSCLSHEDGEKPNDLIPVPFHLNMIRDHRNNTRVPPLGAQDMGSS